ncbi:tryptophan synthase subunit beta [bacterium]|nr:tryptophan synthase subunit beta [bacterium]
MSRSEIKICGVTRPVDARLAEALGADILGMVFCESPRRVNRGMAQEISDSVENVAMAGVFRGTAAMEIAETALACGLDYVQLHEPVTEQYLSELRACSAARIIVAVEPQQLGDKAYLRMLAASGIDSLLLDLPKGCPPGTTLTLKDIDSATASGVPLRIAGGLNAYSAVALLQLSRAIGVDVASGVELSPGIKHPAMLSEFITAVRNAGAGRLPSPGADGRIGPFGGAYVPETLVPALEELSQAFSHFSNDGDFRAELATLLREFAGRRTPLYHAARLSEMQGRPVLLKREDLVHTGAHKLNNCIGQALLARRMGCTQLIAETGAGQHGVAVATTAAMMGMGCRVYMGSEDIRRQGPNLRRMELLGAEVRPVDSGSRTLKDATSEAIRDWVANCNTAHYLIGSAVGPHPYPTMVRDFQAVIGNESLQQCRELTGDLPGTVVASVGGGSNAIGMFAPFIAQRSVRLLGAEAGGHGNASGQHAAALGLGRPGVLHGSLSYLLQDGNGQVEPVHSISAGLDYPGVGPEHSFLHSIGRVEYMSVTDREALEAFHLLCRTEGIIPALESSHALALALRTEGSGPLLVCLSGRGDKDIEHVLATQRSLQEDGHEAA